MSDFNDAPDFETGVYPEFPLEEFNDLAPSKQPWRVKGLWPAVGVCFVAGPSMAGKTFWMLDALAKLRMGAPVLGRKSKSCGIVYVAAEDANGVRTRVAGLRSVIGPLQGFNFIGRAPDLTDIAHVEGLHAALHLAKMRQAELGVELGVVVIDTMSASIPGADENGSKDMSPVLFALQRLAAELGVLIVMVAHTGKDESRGVRGWSGLLANADGLVMLEAPEGDVRAGTVTKVKNGQTGYRFAFGLRVVEVGEDEDGDVITTCVVEEADVTARPKGGPSRLSPKQQIMLRAIHLCIEAGQVSEVPPGPGVPLGQTGVLRRVAKERAMREGFTDGDEQPDTIRRTLNTAIADLVAKERVRVQGGHVWPLP